MGIFFYNELFFLILYFLIKITDSYDNLVNSNEH